MTFLHLFNNHFAFLFFKFIVSSGGMLVQNLNYTDFNNENMSKFDGTMVYAQNKRQQVP